MGNYYNVLMDLVGMLLVGAIFMFERRHKRNGDPISARLLHTLLVCCTLVFLFDISGLLLDGKVFPGARPILWIVDSAYWVFQAVYCWLWLIYVDYWAYGSATRLSRRCVAYSIPIALELLFILSNPFAGWLFTISSGNVYVRGAYYLPNMLPYVLYIAAALIITIRSGNRSSDAEQKHRKLSFVIYMFLPICGVVLSAFIYGISWLWPMVALSLLMVYLNVQQQTISNERLATARAEAKLVEKQLAAAKLESELTESHVAIMLSQIQPHFLYNSLNTIDALCDIDTKAAQTAIRRFAKYLRGNMDAISRKTPVPFRDELAHLREYLTLETLRFDNIQIDYDLEIMDFMLPALSLQPIVENAVKYGVLERVNGGTITISTRDKGDYVQITVKDDGVGFDKTRKLDTRCSHIGISNVRSRVESMCGGTLTVDSVPDVGTTVTFIIPWGGVKL